MMLRHMYAEMRRSWQPYGLRFRSDSGTSVPVQGSQRVHDKIHLQRANIKSDTHTHTHTATAAKETYPKQLHGRQRRTALRHGADKGDAECHLNTNNDTRNINERTVTAQSRECKRTMLTVSWN